MTFINWDCVRNTITATKNNASGMNRNINRKHNLDGNGLQLKECCVPLGQHGGLKQKEVCRAARRRKRFHIVVPQQNEKKRHSIRRFRDCRTKNNEQTMKAENKKSLTFGDVDAISSQPNYKPSSTSWYECSRQLNSET